MNRDVLEEVLGCTSLPSLPAVAVRVIELTSDTNVSLDDLAETIQNDQGLAAKVLRTVNSSFYGLRKPCATIRQSLVVLGLSAVKSLALGFSLVSALDDGKESRFDHVGYWRRCLFAGVGAKVMAHAARKPFEDEAFLGGLLQDIGVMALYKALGERYLQVLEQTQGDHRLLVKHELAAFEVQHPDIGAMLAQRWKLPAELILPVKYHERPTAAPAQHTDLIRCVGLGNLAHDVLSDEDARPALNRFYALAKQWFDIPEGECDQLIRRIGEATKEMSSLFRLNTGKYRDADEVLARAADRLVELSRKPEPESPHGSRLAGLLTDTDRFDALTGLYTAASLSPTAETLFERARLKADAFSVVEVTIDRFQELIDAHGVDAGDEVFLGTAALLKKHFEPMGGVASRSGPEAFAVLLPGVGRVSAAKAAEEFRVEVERVSRQWKAPSSQAVLGVTVSVGAVSAEAEAWRVFKRPDQVLSAASRAVWASREAGGNRVRVFTPKIAA